MEVREEDFMTEEEKETGRKMTQLKAQAERGRMFTDWLRSPAGVLFAKMLDEHISDARNAWLAAPNPEAAEAVRVQSQAYLKVRQWLGAQEQAGKAAESGLKQFEEEGAALSGIIKPPQGPGIF